MPTSSHDRASRVATNHRARMRDSGGAIIKAYITNLSRSGFRASTNRPLSVGDEVTIFSDEGDEYPGVIRWADGTEAGGEFLRRVDLPEGIGRLTHEPRAD